jgi:hypothetical protein
VVRGAVVTDALVCNANRQCATILVVSRIYAWGGCAQDVESALGLVARDGIEASCTLIGLY